MVAERDAASGNLNVSATGELAKWRKRDQILAERLVQISFRLNREEIVAEIDPVETVLAYLRDRQGLMGAKNGCGAGHCGACTVVVDGEAHRACVTRMRRIAGRSVLTIEGLATGKYPDVLLHPLQYAFLEADAVQCGFCTPGMIMAAYALLSRNPDPGVPEIREALRHNLCRCTGYQKIVEAVQRAAELMRADKRWLPAPSVGGSAGIGESPRRYMALEKVLGRPLYTADLSAPGALAAKLVTSAYPHAEIVDIDTSAAQALRGVVRVITHADVPGHKCYGLVKPHQPILAFDRVRMMGDPVAMVLAETQEVADAAARLVKVTYRELPGVFTPQAALAAGAPWLHADGNLCQTIAFRKGNPEAAFERDDLVVAEGDYFTPSVEHAYLEPEGAIAYPTDDGAQVFCPSQGSFEHRENIARMLGIPADKCRVVFVPAGGAFGGREEPLGAIHAALGAYLSGRPVKLVLTRPESILMSTKRHAQYLHYRTAAGREGDLVAMDISIALDTGAYASLGPAVGLRSATFATGPYCVPNLKVEVKVVHTNNPVAGAMRGFGSPQVAFASETQMERLARKLGIDSIEFRRRNALRPGRMTATGDVLGPGNAFEATLDAVEKSLLDVELPPVKAGMRRGIGVASAFKNVGLGNGVEEHAGCAMDLLRNGKLVVRVGCVDTGQGSDTIVAQLAAAATGVPLEDITVRAGDTLDTPDSGITTGSRMTFLSGNAVHQAGLMLRERLAQEAQRIGMSSESPLDYALLHHRLSRGGRPLTVEYEYRPPTTQPLAAVVPDDPGEPAGGPQHYAYCFATHAAVVDVDEVSGAVHLQRVIASGDAGTVIHRGSVEGQVEGGVCMGIGYALYEELLMQEGRLVSTDLRALGVPRAAQVPDIDVIIVEDPVPAGPLGAKGMGEIVLSPTAPAIANAILAATGFSPSRLPVRSEDIRAALLRTPRNGIEEDDRRG
jgi:aldehyde oxidoreductase